MKPDHEPPLHQIFRVQTVQVKVSPSPAALDQVQLLGLLLKSLVTGLAPPGAIATPTALFTGPDNTLQSAGAARGGRAGAGGGRAGGRASRGPGALQDLGNYLQVP